MKQIKTRIKNRHGALLIELIMSLTILLTITATTIPLFNQLTSYIYRQSHDNIQSAITMEKIITELEDSRAILYPRAVKGAQRARSLIFLNRENHIVLIYSDGTSLWKNQYNNHAELVKKKIGNCSSILFHDRGHTRRCLRIRTSLRKSILATTVQLTNSPLITANDIPSQEQLTVYHGKYN